MKLIAYRRVSRITTLLTIVALLMVLAGPSHPASAAIRSVNYTALGDSLAVGLFALPGLGYVPLYATDVRNAAGMPVNLFPLGVPGWTSTDLADALKNNGLIRLFVMSADVLTLDIGGNDMNQARSSFKNKTCGDPNNQGCLMAAVTTFNTNWNNEILPAIRQLRHGRPTVLRTMDIYNPFVLEDAGLDFAILNGYLTKVNDIIHSTAGIVPYAKVYEAFNLDKDGNIVDPRTKDLLSFDGFHPNTRGHALIASKLAELGYASTVIP